ncbi:MAG: hypothetical protein ACLFTG_11330 [Alphaproteobacteria bacterium]
MTLDTAGARPPRQPEAVAAGRIGDGRTLDRLGALHRRGAPTLHALRQRLRSRRQLLERSPLDPIFGGDGSLPAGRPDPIRRGRRRRDHDDGYSGSWCGAARRQDQRPGVEAGDDAGGQEADRARGVEPPRQRRRQHDRGREPDSERAMR